MSARGGAGPSDAGAPGLPSPAAGAPRRGGLTRAARPGPVAGPAGEPAAALAERFDRRGTEPFELFRSEFGQNYIGIQEFFSRIYQKSKKFRILKHFPE